MFTVLQHESASASLGDVADFAPYLSAKIQSLVSIVARYAPCGGCVAGGVSMPIVVDNVTCSYRSVPAVHHACVCFEEGQSWAIVGPNGAGKSTLLKALMRLLPADTGVVRWEQLQRKDLAYLPQQSEIDRSFPISVFDLVALGLWHERGLWGRMQATQRTRIMQALERVGMDSFAQRPIAALSSGQFQRVLFARLLVQNARFLLLDEPFNAMDARTTEALLKVLDECVQQGKGVIAVVHDREQARTRFDHALLIAREVIASGRAADVLSASNLQQADRMLQSTSSEDGWCDMEQAPHGHHHGDAHTH